MSTSQKYLELATHEADRANRLRQDARSARRSARLQQFLSYTLYGLGFTEVAVSTVLLVAQQWQYGFSGTAISAACLILAHFVVPRGVENSRERAHEKDEEAEKHAWESERLMVKYDLAKWTDDFQALMPPPPGRILTADERKYGTHYSQGLHAETARSTRKAIVESNEEMVRDRRQMMERAQRLGLKADPLRNVSSEELYEMVELAEKTEAVMKLTEAREIVVNDRHYVYIVGEGGLQVRDDDGRIHKVSAKLAQRINRDAKKVLDLTDWEGDGDPRQTDPRDRDLVVCGHCKATMTRARHTAHREALRIAEKARKERAGSPVGPRGQLYRVNDSSPTVYACIDCERTMTPQQAMHHWHTGNPFEDEIDV